MRLFLRESSEAEAREAAEAAEAEAREAAEATEAEAEAREAAEAAEAEAELTQIEICECVANIKDEREIVRQISERESNGSTPATRDVGDAGANFKVQSPGVAVSDPGQVEASWLEYETPIPDQWRQSNSESDNFSIGSPKRFNRSK